MKNKPSLRKIPTKPINEAIKIALFINNSSFLLICVLYLVLGVSKTKKSNKSQIIPIISSAKAELLVIKGGIL